MDTPFRRMRGSANIIGLTILAENAFSGVLLTPLMLLVGLLPLYGRTMAELSDIAAYLLVFAVPFLLMARVDGMTWSSMAGSGRPPRSVYITAILLALGLSTAGGFLGGFVELFLNDYGVSEPVSRYVPPDSPAALVLHVISIAILPPLLEELCYRGFYFKVAERTAGSWPAIWITAILFWTAHASITILPLALGFGVMGGIFRTRYDSILPSMVGHIAVNLLYIVMNLAQAMLAYPVYMILSYVEILLTLLLGAIGLFRLRKECRSWNEMLPDAIPPVQAPVARAYLTSIPLLAALAFSLFYTIRNLEFIV